MQSSTNNNLNSEREWLKVSELSAGMRIAVPKAECFNGLGLSLADDSALEADQGDVMWDEIEEIREVGQEQVWDIEVEGTHNFVAGHLIDKNTKNQLSESEEAEYLMEQEGITDEEKDKLNVIARESRRSAAEADDRGNPADNAPSDKDGIASPLGTKTRNDNKRDIFYGAIFAHNTYIESNLGVGYADPHRFLSVAGTGYVAGNFEVASGTFDFGSGTATSTLSSASGLFGIATTTPWAQLSVEGQGTNPAFSVSDTSNNTDFVVDATGQVGIGTASPSGKLNIYGDSQVSYGVYDTPLRVQGDTYTYLEIVGTGDQAGVLYNRDGSTGWMTGLNNDGKFRIGDLPTINEAGVTAIKDGSEGITIDTTGLVGIGTTTPGAYLAVQALGTATSTPLLTVTDYNNKTSVFNIAATSRDVQFREDLVQTKRADLTTLANINDIFVYDTTKDSDGGAWTNDDKAKASSWYNETIDATGINCTIDTDDRCGQRPFPQKAIIIATNDDLFIFDAKDNTQWMNFDDSSTLYAVFLHANSSSPTMGAVFALNGKIYIGLGGDTNTEGLWMVDFTEDNMSRVTNGNLYYFNEVISGRNSTVSLGRGVFDVELHSSAGPANDAHAVVISGKTYLAVATDNGVTLINETNETAIDYDVNSGDDSNDIYLTSDGTLYYTTETAQTLNVFKDVHLDKADITSGSADIVYDESGVNVGGTGASLGPAIFIAASTINDLYVTEGTSFMDSQNSPSLPGRGLGGGSGVRGLSNTVFIAHNLGLTKLSENNASSTMSAVKYYGAASTTEEMIGDIRGMWTFETFQTATTTDASVKDNNGLGVNIAAADQVSGVRGYGLDFDGSTEYINIDEVIINDASGDTKGTWSAWVKPTDATPTASEEFISMADTSAIEYILFYIAADGRLVGNNTDAGTTQWLVETNAAALSNGVWAHIALVQNGIEPVIYVDGVAVAQVVSQSADKTKWIADLTGIDNARIGSVNQNNGGEIQHFDGDIDEVMITAQALTASQIKHMYEVGKKALQNHTASRITGLTLADEYQQVYGSTSVATAVTVDEQNNLIYVGTNDGSNTGGVSAIGLYSDTIEDVWASDTWLAVNDDDNDSWNADDIVAIGVTGRYPSTIAIATDAEFWIETEEFSFDKYRSLSVNPHGDHLIQTALTVKNDLEIGDSISTTGVLGLATAKRAFKVSSDGVVTAYSDVQLSGRTNLHNISNINDVFVYDTTKDSDAGAWTSNTNAQATSWYNEQIDASSQTCDFTQHDRCGSRAFPQKAVIVTTNDNLYIFDAKDNTMWMRFDDTSGTGFWDNQATRGNNAVYALNGTIYVARSGAGLSRIQLKNDKLDGLGTGGHYDWKGDASQRNDALSWNSADDTSFNVLDDDGMNDVHAEVINSKTYIAVAMDAGVSIINEDDETVVDLVSTGTYNDVNNVWLTSGGELYFSSQNSSTYASYYNLIAFQELPTSDQSAAAYQILDGAVRYSGPSSIVRTLPINTVSYTSLETNINDLFITEDTSFVDGKSNTIYLGFSNQLTKLSENNASTTMGAVKYYTHDYITEEMIGDIRGMWGMNRANSYSVVEDLSVNTNDGTTGGTMTAADVVPGVRGTALDFDGSDDYVALSSLPLIGGTATPTIFTIGAWIKIDVHSPGGLQSRVFNQWADGSNTNIALLVDENGYLIQDVYPPSSGNLTSTQVLAINKWYHVVATRNGNYRTLYINGDLEISDSNGETYTGTSATTAWIGGLTGGTDHYLDGKIDEVMITATALTPSQIKHMYDQGRRSLEQKSLPIIYNATTVGNDRIGDTASVVLEDGGWIGSHVEIVGGTGVGQTRQIVATSTTTFYVDPPFDITPDTTSDFQVISNQIYISEFAGSTTTATTVSSVFVDENAGILYVGVDNSDNTGGVTAIGLDSDNILDIWHNQAGKTDDKGNAWSSDNISAISASSGPNNTRHPERSEGSRGYQQTSSDILAITGTSTSAFLWIESAGKSLKDELATLGGSHLVKTDLTVQNDLEVGDTITVWGVLGENTTKPAFKVTSDGIVSAYSDVVLSGRTNLHSISNINDVFVYDTTKDSDAGAWTSDTNAQATSWYNEQIDASSQTCDFTSHDRCGSRAFPQKAVIVATDANVYIFDAKDNTMWMKFDEAAAYDASNTNVFPTTVGDTQELVAVYALNGSIYLSANTGTANQGSPFNSISFISEKIRRLFATTSEDYLGEISERNSGKGYTTYDASYELVQNGGHDIHAAVICSEPLAQAGTPSLGYTASSDLAVNPSVLTSGLRNQKTTPQGMAYGGLLTNGKPDLPSTRTFRVSAKDASIGALPTIPTGHRIDNYIIKSQNITKNTSTNGGDVFVPINRDGASADTRYTQYSTPENSVKSIVEKLLAWSSDPVFAETFGIQLPAGCKTYVAVATDGGVSIINEDDEIVIDFNSDSDDDVNDVFLTENGDLYYSLETAQDINVYHAIHLENTDITTAASEDALYNESSQPAVFTSAQDITDIFVTEASSITDDISNTIYVSHKAGLSKLSENASSTLGAVKYYTQDYITEEMVGDIRGMWTFGEGTMFEDVSVKTNQLTATSLAAADLVPGVRGTAFDFDGSNDYLSVLTAADADLDFNGTEAFSISAWVKSDTAPGSSNQDAIITKWDSANTLRAYTLRMVNDDADTTASFGIVLSDNSASQTISAATADDFASQGIWYYTAFTFNGGTGGDSGDLKLYVDGELKSENASNSSFLGLDDVASDVVIGGWDPQDVNGNFLEWDGAIDEVTVTAEILTPAQIKHMYDQGRRALESKSLAYIDNATTVGNDRIGDTASVVVDDGGWIGSHVEIVGGTGVGQTRRIVATSTTTFYVDPPFDITPDTTSDFQVLSNQIYINEFSGSTTTATTVSSIFVDENAGILYVGVDNSDNTGGVTAIGLDSDNILDIWHSQSGKIDDKGNAWESDNISAISASSNSVIAREGTPDRGNPVNRTTSDILAITGTSTSAFLWIESAGKSLKDQLSSLGGATLIKTNLTAKHDLIAGETLTVWGSRVLGDSSEKPTFRVALDGTVTVREDLILSGGTDLTSMAGINDVFVYDTTKDSDAGAWTNDTNAKATSWFNEPIDATAQTCDPINHDRCGSRPFPQKAVLVATNSNLYIFDAKDNTMWMRFDEGSKYLFAAASTNNTSVFALNSKIYVGTDTTTNGFIIIDYINDESYDIRDDTGHNAEGNFKGSISERNTGKGHDVYDYYYIVNDAVNDVHAAVIDGATYVAVATDGGVSIINETDETVVDYNSDGDDDVNDVFLTSSGDLYYSLETADDINVYYDIHLNNGDITTSASEDALYNEASTPAIFTTAGTTINDIYVINSPAFTKEGARGWSRGDSNTIYIAHNTGLTVLSEKPTDESNGSVKYYTQDYITEEMVGDIRGMWTFGEGTMFEDVSVKTNQLTATSLAAADLVPGVRGTAFDFDGTNDYLTIATANDADLDFNGSEAFSVSAWVRMDTAPGSTEKDAIATKWDDGGEQQGYYFAINNDDADTTGNFYARVQDEGNDINLIIQDTNDTISQGTWHHGAIVWNGGAGGVAGDFKLYVDGEYVATHADNSSFDGIDDVTSDFVIGDFDASDATASLDPFDGPIDEVTVTAEVLTPAQIKHMYESGRRALEQKSTVAIANADVVGNDRIGDTTSVAALAESGGFIGSWLEITGGTGQGQTRQIVATSSTTFYVDPPFDITPDTTSDFQVLSNSIYITDSSTSTTVSSVFVDEDAGIMYVGVNNTDNTGGVTAIGLDSDNILDIWHNQAGKSDDKGNAWNADDVVSISASSPSLQGRGLGGGFGGRELSEVLAIGTDAELWIESAGQSIRDFITSEGSGETANILNVTTESTFKGKFNVQDSETQPIFGVDDITGDVKVREDIEFGSETKLTNLANINDIYVYDTTTDSDGGEWTCNDIAQGTSWYNEPLNTSTRGKTKCFPRKAILVATDTDVFIYDAKDNSEWMEFNVGSNTILDLDGDEVVTSVYSMNGEIYVGLKGSGAGNGQLVFLNFKVDKAHLMVATAYTIYNANISQRNDSLTASTLSTSYVIVDRHVNDVHAAVINNKTYVAVATDAGVSVINEDDEVVYDYDEADAGNATNDVQLTSDGTMYYNDSTAQELLVYYNIQDDYADQTAANVTFNESEPFEGAIIMPSADDIRDIFVTENTSFIDDDSNTIFIATDLGLTKLSEDQTTATSSAVKYYTKDYITEEMIGDVRGMWGFELYGDPNANDLSVKTNTLTGTSIVAANYVSGVRGWGIDLDGTNDWLTLADASDGDVNFNIGEQFTISAWVKPETVAPASGNDDAIVSKYDNGGTERAYIFSVTNDDTDATGNFRLYLFDESTDEIIQAAAANDTVSQNVWYHVVGTFNGGAAGVAGDAKLYVNGVEVASSAANASFLGMEDVAADFVIGDFDASDATAALDPFDGVIDEVMVIGTTTLEAVDIKHIYEQGKRALESGVEGTADLTTSAHSAFRIGVASNLPYSAGEFINSVIQIYDGPGGATSTRFITQTASSTSDYYIQFSPDHAAAIADNDTFSVGPSLIAGTTNRVTSIAVDDYNDFIYIGTTDGDGTDGSVSKIALSSDTLVDVWHTDTGKQDDLTQPYGGASTTAISFADNTLAISNNSDNANGFWSETASESLDRKLTKPKTVFTVIDKVQTPRIDGPNGTLELTASSTVNILANAFTVTGTTSQEVMRVGYDMNVSFNKDANIRFENDAQDGYINFLSKNTSDEFVLGTALSVEGMQAAEDAGSITWFNMPVSSSASDNDAMSITYKIDNNNVFTIYGQADGSGGADTFAVGVATTTPTEALSVNGRLYVGGTGTSTIENNLYVMGTLRSTVSYVGDLVFANDYRFTESDDLISHLRVENDFGKDLVTYYREGKIGIGSSEQAGALCVDDGSGVCDGLSANAGDIYYNAAHAAYTDIAEMYPTDDNTLSAGEIVSLRGSTSDRSNLDNDDPSANNGIAASASTPPRNDSGADLFVSRAHGASPVLGIISTNPGLTLGDYGDNSRHPELVSGSVSNVAVALSGRVPVKISLENGPIQRGDYLTASKEIAGAASKLIGSGQVIGTALQDYNGAQVEKLTKDQDPYHIMVFIQMFYQYDDSKVVRIFDNKIIDIQAQIDQLKARVEELEKWKGKLEE